MNSTQTPEGKNLKYEAKEAKDIKLKKHVKSCYYPLYITALLISSTLIFFMMDSIPSSGSGFFQEGISFHIDASHLREKEPKDNLVKIVPSKNESKKEDGLFLLNHSIQDQFQIDPSYAFTSTKTCFKRRDAIPNILCKLNLSNHCKMTHVAEVIDQFWIIAPIYSYDQEKQISYYELHDHFRSYMESFGLSFCTIEALRKGSSQQYLSTKPDREPYDIQVTYRDGFYLRENLLNVAVGKIPEDKWDYFAWIDGHQGFTNPYWWEEAIVKMNKYATLQLFVNSDRLNSSNVSLEKAYGIIYTTTNHLDVFHGNTRREIGNAYSISKEEYRKIGSILDTCVASFCDCLYVDSVKNNKAIYPIRTMWRKYLSQFTDYVTQTQNVVQGRTGFVRGEIYHFEHSKTDFYWTLLNAIIKTDFDIKRDLARDENGTLYLTNYNIKEIMQKTIHKFLNIK